MQKEDNKLGTKIVKEKSGNMMQTKSTKTNSSPKKVLKMEEKLNSEKLESKKQVVEPKEKVLENKSQGNDVTLEPQKQDVIENEYNQEKVQKGQSKFKNHIIFAVFAILSMLSVVFGRYMDERFQVCPLFEIIFIVACVTLSLVYLELSRKKNVFKVAKGSGFSPLYALAIVPIFVNYFAFYGKFDINLSFEALFLRNLALFIFVLYQELYFRCIASAMFEKEGKMASGDVVYTQVVFGIVQLLNLIAYVKIWPIILLSVLGWFALGLLLIVVYNKTKNVYIVFAINFLNSLFISLFMILSSKPMAYGSVVTYLMFVLAILMFVSLAIGIWRPWKKDVKKQEESKLKK